MANYLHIYQWLQDRNISSALTVLHQAIDIIVV